HNAGLLAHGDVVAASCVGTERTSPDGRVVKAFGVSPERCIGRTCHRANGRVARAGSVVPERCGASRAGVRPSANRRVVGAYCVRNKCINANGSVEVPGVKKKRLRANRGVALAGIGSVECRSANACISVPGVAGERPRANGRVVGVSCIEQHRSNANGRVLAAGSIAKKRSGSMRGVEDSGGVVLERRKTNGSVTAAGTVAKEREHPVGGVASSNGVGKKRPRANRCVVFPRVEKERVSPYTCAEAAVGEAQQRIYTDGSVVEAGSDVRKSELPIGRVAYGKWPWGIWRVWWIDRSD